MPSRRRTERVARKYNFSAGPAMLPEAVLHQAAEELLDWQGLGASVVEISHRSAEFSALAERAEQYLRTLLQIPAEYAVLFLQGGATAPFAFVPLNLLGECKSADYVATGHWSQKAIAEARRYCEVRVVASPGEDAPPLLPPVSEWPLGAGAAYLHYTANETIDGVEFHETPDVAGTTLVSDMSSNLLSRPLAIERFGLVYAGAQKNIGPAGLCIVIIHRELLQRGAETVPSVFRYRAQAEQASMLNTPPTFAWYVASLVFRWLLEQGGVAEMEQRNIRKAGMLYTLIDQSDFYCNRVPPENRSRMNVPFQLAEPALESRFLEEASAAGLCNLRGHRAVGGMRASIYNAMPEQGVQLLADFMRDFESRCA